LILKQAALTTISSVGLDCCFQSN